MTPLTPEIEEFRDRIEAKFGLVFDDGRKDQVAEAFVARQTELKIGAADYLRLLDTDVAEWERIATLLTVPESYFFRHGDHLRAFIDIAVPNSMSAHPEDRTLRILSIGCANGEEPYTVSMALLEGADLIRDWNLSIRACDVNPEALRQAQRGLYTNWALRSTSPALKARYFTPSGNRYRIADHVRQRVRFELNNALELYRPEIAGSIDVIFFRNVLIYFSPEAIRAAINSVAHMLAPSGYLFLGPAETLRGVSDDFDLCHTHETFYYRRKSSIGKLIPFSPFHREKTAHKPTALEAYVADSFLTPLEPVAVSAESSTQFDTAWMEEIERSTERIRGLQDGQVTPRHRPVKPATAQESLWRTTAIELERLHSLLSAERYAELLAETAHLRAEIRQDVDVQLLCALAHMNRRELPAAETVCRSVLVCDSLNASSYYIMALCREQAGDLGGAAENDRIAIYLDPTFAMPHMHVALIARRRGDHHSARREFENANLLLARESAGRLIMFGGRFSRDALRDLCRRELRGLGAA